jgi:uncharacterized membrane protein YfcA
MVSFTFFAALGILWGSYLSTFVDAKNLQKGFAYFLMAIAAFILFQQRDTFRENHIKSQSSLRPLSEISYHR